MTYKIAIRANDKNQTFIGSINAKLTRPQSNKIASDLNVAFSINGLKWYAETVETEE